MPGTPAHTASPGRESGNWGCYKIFRQTDYVLRNYCVKWSQSSLYSGFGNLLASDLNWLDIFITRLCPQTVKLLHAYSLEIF